MNRAAQLGLWLFNIIVLLALTVLPRQVEAAQNPLNSKCSVTFNNSRATSGNNFYYQASDTAAGDYLGNNGHVRLWMADINGQALNALPPSVTSTNSYQGINQYRITECTADNTTCGGNLPFSMSDMPGGKYLAYCDVNINSGPIAGVQCSGNPFCTWGVASDSYTNTKYSPSNFCTTPPGPDTQYCQPVYAGQSPVKIISVAPFISNIARSCAGPNNPAFTITTPDRGNFQQLRILANGFNVTPGGFNGGTYSGSGYTNAVNYNFQVEGLASDGSWVSSSTINGGSTMQALDCTPAPTPTISTLANSCTGPNQPNLAFFWSSTGATRYYLQVWTTTRGLIHDGYYNFNNYAPPNQGNGEGFYIRVYAIKNIDGSDLWSAYSDYGTIYNQNCGPAATPTITIAGNYCEDANRPRLTFAWSSAGATQYYAQAWSSTRGLIFDSYTTATSYAPPSQSNSEGFYMRVYSISSSGAWSTNADYGTSYNLNCVQPGAPVLTQTPVCGGAGGTQSQINLNWATGSNTQEIWTYDNINSWAVSSSTRNYTLNTTPGATYQLQAADRRFVPNQFGGQHFIQTYQNGAYATFNQQNSTAVSNVGTPSVVTSIAGPDCSPPGTFSYTAIANTNAQCAASGTATITVNINPSAGAAYYVITRNGADGVRTFTTTSSSYIDNSVARNQTYTYSVTAYRTLFDGRVVSTAGTPPNIIVSTAWCDAQAPQILGVATPASGCYDRFNWTSNNVFRIRAQDLPAGGSGIANVTVRLVKSTAPISQTDYPTTYDAGNDIYVTNPVSLTIGNAYNEYQVWAKADDRVNPTNTSGWVQMFPPTNTAYYFYTQPSCAAPFVQTNQGSVHSNQGINVPTPGPTAAPTRRGGPSPI